MNLLPLWWTSPVRSLYCPTFTVGLVFIYTFKLIEGGTVEFKYEPVALETEAPAVNLPDEISSRPSLILLTS